MGAVTLAAGVTIALLTLLRVPAPPAGKVSQATIAVMLLPWREPVRLPPPKARPQPSDPPQRIPAPSVDRPHSPTDEARPATATTPDATQAAPAPPFAAASQPEPLRLELRPGASRAARDSVRAMADAAGTYIGDERPSEQQRLAAGVAKGARADCLAANENASLLSAFVIAYTAVAGRCK